MRTLLPLCSKILLFCADSCMTQPNNNIEHAGRDVTQRRERLEVWAAACGGCRG